MCSRNIYKHNEEKKSTFRGSNFDLQELSDQEQRPAKPRFLIRHPHDRDEDSGLLQSAGVSATAPIEHPSPRLTAGVISSEQPLATSVLAPSCCRLASESYHVSSDSGSEHCGADYYLQLQYLALKREHERVVVRLRQSTSLHRHYNPQNRQNGRKDPPSCDNAPAY